MHAALLQGQVVEVAGLLLLQAAGLLLQLLLLQGPPHHQGEVVDAEGLGDKVVGPLLHAFHRIGHRTQTGHDDHRNLGVADAGLLQDLQGPHHRHLQVAEDHLHRLSG